MFTAKETDQRKEYLLNELNRLQVMAIYSKDFRPEKVPYYNEQIEIIKYELSFVQ